MDTAFSTAFRRAGIKPTEERLREIALKAMVEHADKTFMAAEAIWAEVQKSPTLMAELFKHGWRREVSVLMQRVRNDIESAERGNALKRPIERKAAVVAAQIREEERREEAAQREEERLWQERQDREHEERLAAWRMTQIGSLVIGTKPVWQNSAGTVRAWLATEKRRWRTVELLIEGLPNDERPIEYYRKPEEVAALWRAARVKDAAATD